MATRKLGRPLLPVLGVVVLVLVAGGLLVAVTTVDMERGSLSVCPEGSVDDQLEVDGRQVCTFTNLNGTEATFGTAIRNNGPLPVTVSEVPLEPLDLVGFTPTAVHVAQADDDRRLEEFDSFRLAPDEERLVQVVGELPACEEREEGGATTFTDLALRVRVLGIPQDAAVPIEPAVRLVSEPC